jgi:hypothetical protein
MAIVIRAYLPPGPAGAGELEAEDPVVLPARGVLDALEIQVSPGHGAHAIGADRLVPSFGDDLSESRLTQHLVSFGAKLLVEGEETPCFRSRKIAHLVLPYSVGW